MRNEGMGDTCHVGEPDGGLENDVAYFSFIRESGEVYSGNE